MSSRAPCLCAPCFCAPCFVQCPSSWTHTSILELDSYLNFWSWTPTSTFRDGLIHQPLEMDSYLNLWSWTHTSTFGDGLISQLSELVSPQVLDLGSFLLLELNGYPTAELDSSITTRSWAHKPLLGAGLTNHALTARWNLTSSYEQDSHLNIRGEIVHHHRSGTRTSQADLASRTFQSTP